MNNNNSSPLHRPATLLLLLLHATVVFLPSSCLSTCSDRCGALDVRYPLGTGFGCGSPHFYPSVTCISGATAVSDEYDNNSKSSNKESSDDDDHVLVLTTHTGTYPITFVSYSTSTLIISPPLMSTCSSMHPSAPRFGLDWSAPFQLDSSVFVLLGCPPPTSSLASRGNFICDAASSPRLCGALLECPSVYALGLSLFAPTNTCCVYSPASLGPKGELDLQSLRCAAYASVMSLGVTPMDAGTWEYGVSLKYEEADIEVDGVREACSACESSGGVCGYTPPKNYFVCVCKSGVNTSTNCYGQVVDLNSFWQSAANKLTTNHGILSSRLFMMLILGCCWFMIWKGGMTMA